MVFAGARRCISAAEMKQGARAETPAGTRIGGSKAAKARCGNGRWIGIERLASSQHSVADDDGEAAEDDVAAVGGDVANARDHEVVNQDCG